MKRFFLALSAMVLIAGTAMAGVPANGLRMGDYYCPQYTNTSCEKIYGGGQEVINAANECVAQRLGIKDRIMEKFSSSGADENCVTASKTYTDESGIASWAICCIRSIESEGTCGLFCVRYTSPK